MKKISSIKYFCLKMLIRTIGKWSDGIRLAMKEGFTSGIMLDYIYKNQSSGKFFFGKIIDKIFLGHIGWEVIRQRKNYLCANLEKAIDLTLASKDSVRICDVAAGPALYITSVLEKYKDKNVSAEIRDIDSRWLEEAKKRADAKGLKLTYKVANALETGDFTFDITPDIFVASGFYDWFNDAEMIKKSMRLIYESLPKNGFFVFTNQSGHVALDMTNYLFNDFNHKPLEMVTWDTDLINSWVKEIGFTIMDVKKDEQGYYSNVLAVKN
ncbi:MAG: class I SAM-dependent methyltransferase family protein [Thermoguttaceae bacterium]